MDTIELVDPELREFLDSRPKLRLNREVLPKSRAFITKAAEAQPKPDLADLSVTEISVPSAFGAPAIRVLSYRPTKVQAPLPAILHAHAGGFVMGAPEMTDIDNRLLAHDLQCAIFSVDYRLAPESPYPAAMQDVYSVLAWLHDNADTLGLDSKRIGIKGESGGGGIAAAVALYTRDQNGPKLAFQHLIYPMIDDRTAVRTDLPAHAGEFFWTQEHNLFGWESLLGATPGADDVSPYAAAARAQNLSGLPRTYISVGDLDLFCEENIEFAGRLSRSGVPVEMHVYPGAYHGFRAVAHARVSRQADRDSREALRRALHG